MAKIVEAVRPTAASKMAAECDRVAAVEREIADLEQAKAAKLLEDDETEALKLGDKIATATRRLALHQERVAGFRKQHRRETIAARQKAQGCCTRGA
jgi:hypothetical protein